MSKMKLLVPVLCAALLSFYAIGCGSNATGGGGGGSAGGASYTGKLSDPYIRDAIVILDLNGSGSYDANVTGEMIATTDANGEFTFPATPTIGTIEMVTHGKHLGRPYDGALMKKMVDGSGAFNITPLTDWVSHGITEGAVAGIITNYGGVAIDPGDISPDPMGNLAAMQEIGAGGIALVKGIKASIIAYSVSRIASDEYGPNFTEANLKTTLMISVEQSIGQAVNDGISDNVLNRMNAKIIAQNNNKPNPNAPNMALATADQIAKSAFNIAKYIADKKIASRLGTPPTATYPYTQPGDTTLEAYGKSLGMRYYLMDNYPYNIAPPQAGPYAGKTAIQIALESGQISDEAGTIITTAEVNPGSDNPLGAVVGFAINTASGTIEVLR
jgi:hypothetical protein